VDGKIPFHLAHELFNKGCPLVSYLVLLRTHDQAELMGVLLCGAGKRQGITGARTIEHGMRLVLAFLVLQVGKMLTRASTPHRHALDNGSLTAGTAWSSHRAHRAQLAQVAWQAWPFPGSLLNVLSSP